MLKVRWIKQKAIQTSNREAGKTKLMILIDKSKRLEKKFVVLRITLVEVKANYNFKSHARESGNTWKVITENFSSCSLFNIGR